MTVSLVHRLDIKPSALDLIILLHQGTRLSKTLFYLNPLSKIKEHSAGAKRNRSQGSQKGLVTNRAILGSSLTIVILLPAVTD